MTDEERTMPTDVDGYREAFRQNDSNQTVMINWACFAGLIAVVLLFAGDILARYIPVSSESLFLTGSILLVSLIGAGALLGLRSERRIKHFVCRHCQSELRGNRKLVIATQRCYHCGRRVLDDPEESSGEDSSTAVEQT